MASGPAHPPASADAKAASKTTVTGWLAANAIAVLTVAGAVFYVALRLAYETFYGALQLTPEDVGIGYGDALVRSAGLGFYVGVGLVAVVAAALLGGKGRLGKRTVSFLDAVVVVVAIGLFVVAWYEARRLANHVERDGHAGTPLFFLDTGIRAERAKVLWLGPAHGPKGLKDHLAYLGSAGGSVVLYDVDTRRSLRIPSNDVAVSILPDKKKK